MRRRNRLAPTHATAQHGVMEPGALSEAITREIVELHALFEEWFRGKGPENLQRLERVLSPNFTMTPPNGTVVDRGQLLADLAGSRGSRRITITIEQPRLLWSSGDAALASYVEEHRHTDYTTQRRSTALFTLSDGAPNGVAWQHLHETWIQAP